MDTTQTPEQIENNPETEIDRQLAAASVKTAEITRVQTAIDQMQAELGALDGRIAIADVAAADGELKARLDGVKPPKVNGESDTLHGSRRRLLAAVEAAKAMQADLAAQREEAFDTASMLAKNIASQEFADQAKRVADAWSVFLVAFGDYSAAAQHAGVTYAGWDGPANYSQFENLRVEAIEGVRVKIPDRDNQAYSAAIGRSNSGRVLAKIDAARLL